MNTNPLHPNTKAPRYATQPDEECRAFLEQTAWDLSGKTNRSLESVARRYELDFLDLLPEKPPRICALNDRTEFIDSVAIPESATELLRELRESDSLPLLEEAQRYLEKVVAAFNRVDPDTICCTSNLIVSGFGWRWNETEKLTGFEYWPHGSD